MNENLRMLLFVSVFFILSGTGTICGCNSGDDDPDTGTGDTDTSSETDTDEGISFISEGECGEPYWPTEGWLSCEPEGVGMDSEKLMDVFDYIAQPEVNTKGTVIIKDGYIVAEAYFANYTADAVHNSYSVAKSFLSATMGIAIEEGYLSGVDEKVYQYFKQWQKPETAAQKQDISVRDLLAMSSGLEWDESNYYDDDAVNDAFEMGSTPDYIQYVLDKPVVAEPGTSWVYSSGDSMLLSGIIQHLTGMPTLTFAREHLLDPIGLPAITWGSDPAGYTIGGWGIRASVRDYAKFGYLYLNDGNWDGDQIVPEAWVTDSTGSTESGVGHYGYQWWLLPALSNYQTSDIPTDTYLAWGIYTQQVFVIPEHNLLVVRVANDPGSGYWSEVDFLTLVLDSLI